MKKTLNMFFTILFFFILSILALATDLEENNDPILYFNIGGYKFDIRYSTIVHSDIEYLKNMLDGRFSLEKLPRDQENRIFIDRDQEEAKLIIYYLRNSQLPANFDLNIAKNAELFFNSSQC